MGWGSGEGVFALGGNFECKDPLMRSASKEHSGSTLRLRLRVTKKLSRQKHH